VDLPDVVLLDMGLATDADAVAKIVAAVAPARVVAFGLADDEEAVIRCAEGGVLGYVPCEASVDDLVDVIDAVVRDELIVSPRVAATLLRRVGALAQSHTGGGPDVRLTSRETQIMALVDDGLSNKAIAQRLQIEVATVKNHVHNVLEKLGATGRADAAARVRRSGRFRPTPTSQHPRV
jgi:DNA-binding NarL/FixJ family response regulator